MDKKELAELLVEAWEFPEQPGPAPGELADDEVFDAREQWGNQWTELDNRI